MGYVDDPNEKIAYLRSSIIGVLVNRCAEALVRMKMKFSPENSRARFSTIFLRSNVTVIGLARLFHGSGYMGQAMWWILSLPVHASYRLE